VFYINVPDFIQLLKDNMSNPSEHMQAMIYNIRNADLVIWDDIGTETPTTWVRQTLYTYINHRYSNMLSQIFTSNIMPETLCDEQYMGERIVDRIAGCCDMHEFTGQSRRY
jgi:DNA replication protein DnaC